MADTKFCPHCDKEKPLSEWTKGTCLQDTYHRCKDCAAKYDKNRRDPERARRNHLKTHLGITEDDYLFLLTKQDGKCGLCAKGCGSI